MPLLSVVIPVFNSEKYLGKCLSSLFTQEQSGKIEVICVDDGSTDQSLDIIKEFSLLYPNLKWISQSNNGVSSARNKGMQLATGDYITFVDSDDWVDDSFLKLIVPLMELGIYDCMLFRLFEYIDGTSKMIGSFLLPEAMSGDGKAMIRQIMNYRSPYRGYACGKIIKFDCLKKGKEIIAFDEDLSLFEDELFWVKAAFRCRSVFFSDESFYYYRQNSGSLSAGFSKVKGLMELEARERIFRVVEWKCPELSDLAKSRISLSEGGLIRKCYFFGRNEILKMIRDQYWQQYPVRLVFKLDGAPLLLKMTALICDLALALNIPAGSKS